MNARSLAATLVLAGAALPDGPALAKGPVLLNDSPATGAVCIEASAADGATKACQPIGSVGPRGYRVDAGTLDGVAAGAMTLAPSGLRGARSLATRATDALMVADNGGLCTGSSHPLSGAFSTLADAQAAFPRAGVTSLSLEIDVAAIQDTLGRAAELGGGQVWLPRGTCWQNATLRLPASVELVGYRGATVLMKVSDFGPSVLVGSPTVPFTANAGVRGVTFARDTSLSLTRDNGQYVKLVGADGFTMRDVNLSAFFEGVDVVGGHNIAFDNVVGDGHARFASRYGFKFEQGAPSLRDTHPTDVQASRIYLNGPSVAGACYNWWVTSGEDVKLTQSYIGQAAVANVLFEEDASNAPILDNKIDGTYVDVAGWSSVVLTAGGVPARVPGGGGPRATARSGQLSVDAGCGGGARHGGDGTQVIARTKFAGSTVGGQGGQNLDGVYISGATMRNGAQGVLATSFDDVDVMANGRHGYFFEGGVGTIVTGGSARGNNYLGAFEAGSGVVIGAQSVNTTLTGGFASGWNQFGAVGGSQVFGVAVDAGARAAKLNGIDLSGNRAPYALPPRGTNVEAASLITGGEASFVRPADGQAGAIPPGTRTVVIDPSGSLAGVTLHMPASAYDGETVSVRLTGGTGRLTLIDAAGNTFATIPSPVDGAIYTVRYVAGAWGREL